MPLRSRKFWNLLFRVQYRLVRLIDSFGGWKQADLPLGLARRVDFRGQRQAAREFSEIHQRLPAPLREALPADKWFRRQSAIWQRSISLCYRADRLTQPAWQARCQWKGRDVAGEKLPVLLAFLHFGPFATTRHWLRSRGIRSAIFQAAQAPPIARLAGAIEARSDAATGLHGVEHKFTRHHLRGAKEFLQKGNVLLFSLDGVSDRTVRIEAGGVGFSVGLGAARLAANADALLLPCMITELRPFHYEVWIGEPPPDEALAQPEAALAHLLGQMAPRLLAHPENWTWTLMESITASPRTRKTLWP